MNHLPFHEYGHILSSNILPLVEGASLHEAIAESINDATLAMNPHLNPNNRFLEAQPWALNFLLKLDDYKLDLANKEEYKQAIWKIFGYLAMGIQDQYNQYGDFRLQNVYSMLTDYFTHFSEQFPVGFNFQDFIGTYRNYFQDYMNGNLNLKGLLDVLPKLISNENMGYDLNTIIDNIYNSDVLLLNFILSMEKLVLEKGGA